MTVTDDRTLQREGARLRWRMDGGAGGGESALVLVHGWALSLEYWDAVLPYLASERRVLRYDRRGFGASTGPYDPQLAVGDLIALLDAAQLETACVVGMSQGARVALHAAIEAPQRVQRLVLDGPPLFDAEAGLPLEQYRKLRDAGNLAALRAEILSHPLMQLRDPAQRAVLEQCVSRYAGDDLEGGWRPLPAPELALIRRPTLVLNGALDSEERLEAGRKLTAGIPGARHMSVEDAGHLTALDQPRTWSDLVLDFCAG